MLSQLLIKMKLTSFIIHYLPSSQNYPKNNKLYQILIYLLIFHIFNKKQKLQSSIQFCLQNPSISNVNDLRELHASLLQKYASYVDTMQTLCRHYVIICYITFIHFYIICLYSIYSYFKEIEQIRILFIYWRIFFYMRFL